MTCFCSLNSNNMFQVLRNFTTSLETSNASFALNSQLMTTVLLGRNISGYRNCISATFSNFAHFTLLNSRNYFTLRILWLDVTSLKNAFGQGSQIGPFRPNFRNLGLSQVGGVKKLWLFFLHRKSFLWTKILLFHFFGNTFAKFLW